MNSFSSFLDMGGYAAFVWPSFGLSAVLLIGIFVISLRTLKANRAALNALNRESGRTAPSEGSVKSEA